MLGEAEDRRFPLHRTRARILKVNAAGEAGAIAIYRAQLLVSPFLAPDTVAFLQHALSHEREHLARFLDAMRERNVEACPGTALWVAGGWLLGVASLAGGRRGIMACTAAIESAVHGHLKEQADYLRSRDPALEATLRDIMREEEEHLQAGLAGYDPSCLVARMFTTVISAVTETLIWLATFGDSARMKRAM
ncbi:MAG: demethoxyubiquinone hydroxylase family protein [Maricaulis sp.]|nr:demethoxyubiquinone hydroxylase family protein [Maricaulis sp.]